MKTTPSPANDAPYSAGHPLRICIASPEFIGVAAPGATGMADTAMAQALTAAGHQVTCLFLGQKDPSPREWRRWLEKYQADGVTLIALPPITASELVGPPNLIKSYATYHWLKRNDRFDLIHFPEKQGPGYHTLTAKHHGLAFAETTICVGLHTMTAWLQAGGQKLVSALAEVDTEFMERRAVALADAVVSPNHNLVKWIAEKRQELPGFSAARGAAGDSSVRGCPPPVAPQLHRINELIYFGTLEPRKGIVLFCDALDKIPAGLAEKIRVVTFLGKEESIEDMPARSYVELRSERWPFAVQVISDLPQSDTLHYLKQHHRLAVIPCLLQGSPYGVLECLMGKIPFVASRVGGIPELIAPADVNRVCFEPKAETLCAVLCSALTDGIRPALAVADHRPGEPASAAVPPFRQAAPPTPVMSIEFPDATAYAAIQALSADPTNAIALKVLARMHLNAGLFEAAQEACHLVLKHDLHDAEALQMLEEAHVQEAKLAENLFDSDVSLMASHDLRRPQPARCSTSSLAAPVACN